MLGQAPPCQSSLSVQLNTLFTLARANFQRPESLETDKMNKKE